MKLSSLSGLEILDSRGNPTVRAFVTLEDGSVHASSVPSGASTGSHEATELRDGDPKRYGGKGVQKAVANINNTIAPILHGISVTDPSEIDKHLLTLDGTEQKTQLGANTLLAVSQACVKAAAHAQSVPLWKFINSYYFSDTTPAFPRLMVNVVNGGKHAGWNFDIQEFMIVPTSNTPSKAIREATEIFHELGRRLKDGGLSTLVGDEGGFSPFLSSNEEVIETIVRAAQDIGYHDKDDYNLAIDAAASEFFQDGAYLFKKEGQRLTGEELMHYYLKLHDRYFILSFEDPFHEDDWDHFSAFTKKVSDTSLVVGDDIFTTDPKRIEKGVKTEAANASLIKLNQIGTVQETVEAIKLSREADWKIVISHRSGETEDTFIADFAYGSAADFIKTGSMSRSERLCKYNRLLEIEAGI